MGILLPMVKHIIVTYNHCMSLQGEEGLRPEEIALCDKR